MISDCVAKYTNTTTCAHMNNAQAQTNSGKFMKNLMPV